MSDNHYKPIRYGKNSRQTRKYGVRASVREILAGLDYGKPTPLYEPFKVTSLTGEVYTVPLESVRQAIYQVSKLEGVDVNTYYTYDARDRNIRTLMVYRPASHLEQASTEEFPSASAHIRHILTNLAPGEVYRSLAYYDSRGRFKPANLLRSLFITQASHLHVPISTRISPAGTLYVKRTTEDETVALAAAKAKIEEIRSSITEDPVDGD